MIKLIYLVLALLCLASFVVTTEADFHSGSDDEIECEGEDCIIQLDDQGIEYHSINFVHINEVWKNAQAIQGRDPYFFRLDAFGHVIVGRKIAKHNHLGFIALQQADGNLIAVQNEYYGKGNALNHEHAIKYDPNDTQQESLLDMIEIALRGYLADSHGSATCWTPSEIHQSLFGFNTNALTWHKNMFSKNFGKYGMLGHTAIFKPMDVFLKQRDPRIDELTLQTLNPRYELMRINGNKPECSAVIRPFQKVQDMNKIATDMKNNWGFRQVLPLLSDTELAKRQMAAYQQARLAAAVDPGEMVPRKVKKTTKVVAKPSKTAGNRAFPDFTDDDDFPALGSVPKKK